MAALPIMVAMLAPPVSAGSFFFTTNDPDGRIAIASRGPNSSNEAADDFITTAGTTTLTSATFTGLITGGVPLSNITEVNIDLYHVFPVDSDTGRTPNVPTRVKSPADTEFVGRNSTAGTLSFTPGIVNPVFTAANSVLNGIIPGPNPKTGGEGAITGQEVKFNVLFTTPLSLPAGHYFFVPTVAVTGGDFFWLSAPKPIDPGGTPPGTPFLPDLQVWTRNTALDPDWLRVGADIVGGSAFNAAFSLAGETAVPEPPSVTMLALGAVGVVVAARARCRS
jgi:hypothetical protein